MEVRYEDAQISESMDRLTRIPPTLDSAGAGSTVSRRGNAVLGPASSRLEIAEPGPDKREAVLDICEPVLDNRETVLDNEEPVPDHWEQCLEPVEHNIHSKDGEYQSQSQENRESQVENELEQHGDNEDLFTDWGGWHKGQSRMTSVTRKVQD